MSSGKIVRYRLENIPLFHFNARLLTTAFYSNDENIEISGSSGYLSHTSINVNVNESNMKKSMLNYSLTIIFTGLLSVLSAQGYQRITGTYSKTTANCQCNSLGFLNYTEASGKQSRMYLCFDTEPGSFYEIFNGEKITVEGIVQGMSCGTDGKTFWTMYVQKSVIPMQSRKELVPEFIKQQNRNVPNSGSSSTSSTVAIGPGKYSLSNRSLLPPSNCDDDNARGAFNYFKWKEGVKDGNWTTIDACAMYSTNGYPPAGTDVILHGSWNGTEFVISRWEYYQNNNNLQRPSTQEIQWGGN